MTRRIMCSYYLRLVHCVIHFHTSRKHSYLGCVQYIRLRYAFSFYTFIFFLAERYLEMLPQAELEPSLRPMLGPGGLLFSKPEPYQAEP